MGCGVKRGAAGGVVAQLTGLKRAVTLDVQGAGDWRQWRGRAVAQAGAALGLPGAALPILA